MRIRTQLMTLAALAGFVALFWIALAARALGTMPTDLEAISQAQATAGDALSMLALTSELRVDGDTGRQTRWLAHHAQLSARVDHAVQLHHEPPQLVELRAQIARLVPLFAQFQGIDPSPTDEPTQRSRSELFERLLSGTQSALETQQRWIATLTEAQYLQQRQITWMGLSASATLLVLLLALCLLLARRVLGPLAHLKSTVAASQSARLGEAAAEPLDEMDDVSALKQAAQEQAVLERQLHDITDNLPVLIAYIDKNECYQFTNATFSKWLGTEPRRMFGRKVSEVMTLANYEQRRQHLKTALAGQRVEFNLESTFLGVTRMLQYVYIPDVRRDGTVAGLYALGTDVTELKRVEHRLYQLAHADSLTGLPNRRQFEVCLAECIERASVSAKSISVMFMDIDKFKFINDQFGHATGDAVLKEFAARLRAQMRTIDTAARLSGDEFVVLLEGLDAQIDAEHMAQKIVASIRDPFLIEGVAHFVTTSLGAVFCARPGLDSPLLEYADAALYEAKEAGRNTYRVKTLEAVVH